MKDSIKRALELFTVFFKIGLFTFGGGYAMIPIIQKEVSEKRKWITDEDILDIIAIAESTPGPIAINSATFVGYKTAGFWGAFCSTLGVTLPSFCIILLISGILDIFKDNPYVQNAFWGIRAGVLALILKALYSMYKQTKKNALAYIVMALSFVLSAILNLNVLYIIIACGVFGLVTSLIAKRRCAQ